jgi:hypothetical protein
MTWVFAVPKAAARATPASAANDFSAYLRRLAACLQW